MRALVVEDDEEIAGQLARILEKERFTTDVAVDGEEALDHAFERSYSIIVLDVMLPKRDGWQVCADLRNAGYTTPILMLTARDSIEDRVRGLEGGADDYLPKPFDARELVARVNVLLRREAVHRTGQIEVGDLVVDSRSRTVTRSGKPIALTPREFTLLEALARNEGRTLTRDVILESVWNNEERLENTVNFHITSLRRKVDPDPENRLIHTVHGIGYVLRRRGSR